MLEGPLISETCPLAEIVFTPLFSVCLQCCVGGKMILKLLVVGCLISCVDVLDLSGVLISVCD